MEEHERDQAAEGQATDQGLPEAPTGAPQGGEEPSGQSPPEAGEQEDTVEGTGTSEDEEATGAEGEGAVS